MQFGINMYNNWYGQHQQPAAGTSQGAAAPPAWVAQAGFQTDRTGFGFKPQSGAAMLASLDDKVADADEKLRDFMAEIESMDAEEAKELEENPSLARSKMPGFVSGGHVLPATGSDDKPADVDKKEGTEEGEPLVEPTTSWQHLMDQNTKHYYYWNTVSNEVTWTIPADYTEYLVRHKLYREALAAGRKTMPATKSTKNMPTTKKVEKPKEPEPETSVPTEIGPQLPPSLMNKLAGGEKKEEVPKEAEPPVPKQEPENKPTTKSVVESKAKALSSLVGGYESSEEEEEEEEEESYEKTPAKIPGIKSLVAYDDSYTESPAVQGPEPPPQQPTHGPEPPPTTPVKRVHHPPPAPPKSQAANSKTYNGAQNLTNQLQEFDEAEQQYMYEYDENGDALAYQGDGYGEDTPLEFGPANHSAELGYGEHTADAPLAFNAQSQVPIILTAPPPPPPEEDDDRSLGLSSVEISEYSSVIMDKLHFLDVHDDSLSKLQTLLIQLKTRLDDWQAGGLSKEYLIEKIQETDGMLEVCESESSPAGWRCNWSRKEKQYYYIHEITDEISWTYPEEDVEAVKKMAAQKHKRDKKAAKSAAVGTLAQLTKAIDVLTVDGELKSLFFQKIVEKCTPSAEEDGEVEKTEELKVEINTKEDGELSPAKQSDPEAKRSKRGSKAKADIFEAKNKRGSSKEKYIPRAYRGRSTSKERDKPKAFDDYSKTHERSKPKGYEDHVSSRERSESKERSKPRAFDDRPVLKDRSRSRERAKPKAFDQISNESSRHENNSSRSSKRRHSDSDESTRDNEKDKKSKHKRKHHESSDRKHKKHSKHKKSSRSSKSSKHSRKHRSRSNSSGDSKANEDAMVDLTESPEDKATPHNGANTPDEKQDGVSEHGERTLTPVSKDEEKVIESEDEMDISPLPSPLPQAETTVSTMSPKMSEPAEAKQSDSIDDLLHSMEKEMKETVKPSNVPQPKKVVSVVRPPPPKLPAPPPILPAENLQTQAMFSLAHTVGVKPPPPPPPPQESSALDDFYKEVESELAEKHSTISAPVLYPSQETAPNAAPPNISLANAPVLYTAPSIPADNQLGSTAVAASGTSSQTTVTERGKSPVRFPNTTASSADAPKPAKEKQHKTHKKSSKKASKMPAALVQKWQKVQSEITTDIMNEKRLKDELLK